MQFPITIGLHRSHFIDLGLMLVTLMASVVALAFPRSAAIQLIFCAAIWTAAGLAWWQLSPKIVVIRLERSGQVFIARNGSSEFLAAETFPGATVHPWLTVAKFKTQDGCSSRLIATVDSLNRQDFRRLRVFLRWQTDFSVLNDDA